MGRGGCKCRDSKNLLRSWSGDVPSPRRSFSAIFRLLKCAYYLCGCIARRNANLSILSHDIWSDSEAVYEVPAAVETMAIRANQSDGPTSWSAGLVRHPRGNIIPSRTVTHANYRSHTARRDVRVSNVISLAIHPRVTRI